MRQWLFTGFNAFGQHAYKCADSEERHPLGFREITPPPTALSGNFLIALSWRYTAYALGSTIWLQGLLEEKVGECLQVQAPASIKALAAGETFCLVLLDDGSLHKLPAKLQATLQELRLEAVPATRPQKRNIFGQVKTEASGDAPIISHIACGTHINVAISERNGVWSIPSYLHQFPEPRAWRVQQLVCGHEHALLLNANGDVYGWGNGLRGQLGQATLRVEETPQLLESLAGVKITHIAAGGWHSAAISAFGDLYTWGFNCNGQLGLRVLKRDSVLKEPTVYPLPQLHDLPLCCSSGDKSSDQDSVDDNCPPVRVFAGSRHTWLLRRCGRLWASGWCAYGQLSLDCKQSYLDSFHNLYSVLGLEGDDVDILCGPWSTLLICSK
ncbi:RCC1 domain-containing protein 1 [Scaptodrosophila lebanonensis]|uniref:RCC1 domain-containing protein 1 n=1 Tax=Drosophila lebanonensis TaxID=7225 RepID=A0A6J2T6K9_DROLE|nr:RCC1 domain-containing protein 1 [Scaptodrosophila lebanonensis]